MKKPTTFDVYVSPDGKDKNDGSYESPVMTIKRAMDIINEKKKPSILQMFFFGKVGVFPLWFGYIIVGGLINTLSVHGMNGHMGDWQVNSVWPVWIGLFVMACAAPGLLMWLYGMVKPKK